MARQFRIISTQKVSNDNSTTDNMSVRAFQGIKNSIQKLGSARRFATVPFLASILPGQKLFPEIELAYRAADHTILVCDLENNGKLFNLSRSASETALILIANAATPKVKQTMKGLVQEVFSHNNPLNPFNPFFIRQVILRYLEKHPEFQPDGPRQARLSDGKKLGCHGFLLNERNLYSLQEHEAETVFVFRCGALLEFQAEPYQYIALQPSDILLLGNRACIEGFSRSGQLKKIAASPNMAVVMQDLLQKTPAGNVKNSNPGAFIAIRIQGNGEKASITSISKPGSASTERFGNGLLRLFYLLIIGMAILAGTLMLWQIFRSLI